MNDIRDRQAEWEARHDLAARTAHKTVYGDALSRYLSTAWAMESSRRTDASTAARTATHETAPASAHRRAVIVGVDASPASFAAVDHAAIEAQLRGWALRLVHALPSLGSQRGLSERREAGAALLDELADRVRSGAPTVPVTTALRVGAAADLLVADSADAGLVVVGGHDRGEAGALLGGSVSRHVAAQAAAPVLVVRVPAWPPGPHWAARPILVGSDGSAAADAAVVFAAEEAQLRGCPLVVYEASRTPVGVGAAGARSTTGGSPPDRLEAAGIPVRRRPVEAAGARQALREASMHAAALVVGAHGTGGRTGRRLGSVTRSLIEHAFCPVFVVHPVRDKLGDRLE